MITIGIDPGAKGGIAWIYDDGQYDCAPMPATRLQLTNLLRDIIGDPPMRIKAVVEKVHAMPKNGACSMFTFGKGYGEVLGILTALGAHVHEPTPQAWKKEMLAGTDKGKDASIQRAENLFHNINLVAPGCRIPSDGMAEALLLAEYGRRTCI